MSREVDPPAREEGRAYGVPHRREQIVALLSEAYARNDLEQGELERRLELAERARTIEELDALVADFPADALARPEDGRGAATSLPLAGRDLEREIERLDGLPAPTRFNLLGDQLISVTQTQARVVRAVSVVGDVNVDLRGLSGASGVFLLKVAALVGDTKIHVPRGTEVEMRLLGLVGDQHRRRRGGGLLSRLARRLGTLPEKDDEPTTPPGPTVVVTGFRLIGDTVVIED